MTESEPAVDMGELLALIDRLEGLLDRSELSEIEVEAEGTAVILRTPDALTPATAAVAQPEPPAAPAGERAAALVEQPRPTNAVLAPLTGLYYGAPSPGAEPYVRVGGDIHVGQVIGLIEAMKLFNEIKSDLAGRVTRIWVENGALVKAKQPLIEVEPA
ncbi:MAG TPA: biotin/lipoyl-containing protein [Candidatus Caenarcaniphilales bacterium]|nr:biotin/lipoyl-containing protein [Candidatus Caenarcaniphilales bacterium]